MFKSFFESSKKKVKSAAPVNTPKPVSAHENIILDAREDQSFPQRKSSIPGSNYPPMQGNPHAMPTMAYQQQPQQFGHAQMHQKAAHHYPMYNNGYQYPNQAYAEPNVPYNQHFVMEGPPMMYSQPVVVRNNLSYQNGHKGGPAGFLVYEEYVNPPSMPAQRQQRQMEPQSIQRRQQLNRQDKLPVQEQRKPRAEPQSVNTKRSYSPPEEPQQLKVPGVSNSEIAKIEAMFKIKIQPTQVESKLPSPPPEEETDKEDEVWKRYQSESFDPSFQSKRSKYKPIPDYNHVNSNPIYRKIFPKVRTHQLFKPLPAIEESKAIFEVGKLGCDREMKPKRSKAKLPAKISPKAKPIPVKSAPKPKDDKVTIEVISNRKRLSRTVTIPIDEKAVLDEIEKLLDNMKKTADASNLLTPAASSTVSNMKSFWENINQ